MLQIDPTTSSLLVTEPYNNLPQLQDALDQITFEEYEFDSCLRSTCQSINRSLVFATPPKLIRS